MKKKGNKKFSKKSKILKKKSKIKKRNKLRETKKRNLKRKKRRLRKINRIASRIKLEKIKFPKFNKQIKQFNHHVLTHLQNHSQNYWRCLSIHFPTFVMFYLCFIDVF